MIKHCPKCGSTEIYLWLGGNLGMIYRCKKCGYIGPVALEKVKKRSLKIFHKVKNK